MKLLVPVCCLLGATLCINTSLWKRGSVNSSELLTRTRTDKQQWTIIWAGKQPVKEDGTDKQPMTTGYTQVHSLLHCIETCLKVKGCGRVQLVQRRETDSVLQTHATRKRERHSFPDKHLECYFKLSSSNGNMAVYNTSKNTDELTKTHSPEPAATFTTPGRHQAVLHYQNHLILLKQYPGHKFQNMLYKYNVSSGQIYKYVIGWKSGSEILRAIVDYAQDKIWWIKKKNKYYLCSASLDGSNMKKHFKSTSPSLDYKKGGTLVFHITKYEQLVKYDFVKKRKFKHMLMRIPYSPVRGDCFRMDFVRHLVYWCVMSRHKLVLYMANYKNKTMELTLKLGTRDTYICIDGGLLWTTNDGELKQYNFTSKKTEEIASCGFKPHDPPSVGRYNGHLYLSCYNRSRTQIQLYNEDMGVIKRIDLDFLAVVADE